MRRAPPPTPSIPVAPARPPTLNVRRWQAIGMAAGVLGFLLLALDGLLEGPVHRLDATVDAWVGAGVERGLPLHELGAWGSLPGSTAFTLAASALCAVAWWLWRERRLAAWAVLGGAAGALAVALLKHAFQRERPPFTDLLSYSFPSGHTLGATGTLGILLLLATQVHVDRRLLTGPSAARAWARGITAWVAASLLVALSRVLAQDHWMSDALASLCLGVALVCAVVRVAGIPRPRAKPPPPRETAGHR